MYKRKKAKLVTKLLLIHYMKYQIQYLNLKNNYGQNVHKATVDALNEFKGKECKIGRARMFAEKSKDLDDPGMFAFT